MRKQVLFVLFLLTISIGVLTANALPGDNSDKPLFAPDKIKIQLTVEAYKFTDIAEEMYAEAKSFNIRELDDFLAQIKVNKIIRAHRKVKDTVWEKDTGFDRWFVLSVPDGTDILKTVELLKTNSYIENAIPEGYFYLDYVPNDLYYTNNWGHHNSAQLPSWTGGVNGSHSGPTVGTVGFDSDAQNAWDDTQGLGSASIIIAILDTGVDLTHPDLRLVPGYDFGANDNNPMPEIGTDDDAHGTACAGIAAARGNNSIGVAGIAAGCSIMPLKICGTNGYLEFTYSINALTYAGDHNVDIISMSFGAGAIQSDIYDTHELAIDYAYNHGAVLFASTGNDNTNPIKYPAWNSKVIGVGAASPSAERKSSYSSDGEFWWGSNWGADVPDHSAAVDIMAPTILPTTDIMGINGYDSSNYYMWFNGTSCACPYAAGVAALVLSKYPFLSQSGLRSRLVMSATDMILDGGIGWDRYTGYGMVNAASALGMSEYIWTGSYSSNWSDSRNWEVAVPNSSSDVRILPVEPGCFYPDINTASASCKSLTVFAGASLTVGNYNLTIVENLVVYGSFLQTSSGDVTVNGHVIWGSGSTANMTSAGSEMYVKGHMYFNQGSNIQMTNGTVEFFGDNSSGIYVNETARLYNLRSNKNVGSFLGTSQTSDHDLYIHGNFTNLTDRVFKHQYPGTIHLKGSFVNNILGAFWFNDGTISFEGSSNQSFTNNSALTCYFNHVEIATSNNSTFSLNDDIEVRGNLTINSGIFQSNNNPIYLKGNWTNNVGEAAFIEGDGAVVMNGTENQYLINEHFGTIDLNKTSGEMIIPEGSVVTCDKYNLTTGVYRVTGGNFTVAIRLIQPGICGTIYLDAGTINYHQDEYTRNDFIGNLYINGGVFNVYGGSDDCYWAGTANAALHMTGGIFDFKEKSIVINNLTTVLTIDIVDGTIRTVRDYKCLIPNVNLSGGTLELYGIGNNSIYLDALSSVFNLNISKATARNGEGRETDNTMRSNDSRPDFSKNDRLGSVDALTHLTINGVLTINGGLLNTGAFDITAIGGISVYGILKKTAAGTIVSGGNFYWFDGSVGDISAGSISFGAKWRFYEGCNVVLTNCPVTFIGLSGSTIRSSSTTASFGNLTLNGGGMISPDHCIYLASDSAQPLSVTGTLTIHPGNYLYLNGRILQVTGNIILLAGSSKLTLEPNAILKIGSGSTLTVNNGATLETLGSFNQTAKITKITGNYGLTILSGGNISAEYTVFEYMNTNGVVINSGALVNDTHSFHYCTFRYVPNSTSGRLLTINNAQTINIYRANFPIIPTAGKNIAKTENQGTVNLYNYIGNFSGPAYEYDTYNRINWYPVTPCELSISDFWTVSDLVYVGEENSYGIEILNDSDNSTYLPVRVDVYCNRETMPSTSEVGDEYLYIDPLGPGESVSIEILTVPSLIACTWKTWFRVNRLNEISENDYNDNGDGYVTTQWLALPVVQIATFAYNSQTGQIELAWTYPSYPTINVQIDAFNIYRSINADGPFEYLTETLPVARSYSEPVGGVKYFYQIKAENTWP